MNGKRWALVFAGVFLLCVLAAVAVHRFQPKTVQVYSEGKLLYSLDLRQDTVVTVETEKGTNVITVKNGAVAVTAADCPDGICMKRGFCTGGAPIVCLPHGLVVQFSGEQDVDG